MNEIRVHERVVKKQNKIVPEIRLIFANVSLYLCNNSDRKCVICALTLAGSLGRLHTLICVTFSLPPGVGGWLRLLLVALPELFCLPLCTLGCQVSWVMSVDVAWFGMRGSRLHASHA